MRNPSKALGQIRTTPPPDPGSGEDDPLIDFGFGAVIRRSTLQAALAQYAGQSISYTHAPDPPLPLERQAIRGDGEPLPATARPAHASAARPPSLPPRKERLMEICRELLIELGEDPDREGLADTPRRWADWWLEFTQYQPGNTETTFEGVSVDQVVVVGPMRVWSLCEHHLLPFWCDIWVAYIAQQKVLGLSKFARIAHQAAHRLQVQERLTHQIADEVQRIARTADVVVVGRGEHLCMSMRGIRTPALMTSSVVRGRFRERDALRAETLALMKGTP